MLAMGDNTVREEGRELRHAVIHQIGSEFPKAGFDGFWINGSEFFSTKPVRRQFESDRFIWKEEIQNETGTRDRVGVELKED